MRLAPVILAAIAAAGLCACQPSGDGSASERAVEQAGGSEPTMQRTPKDAATTGAAGATTGAADPNPAGAGATTGATPGDATGATGSTSPLPRPTVSNQPTPPQSP